MMVMPDDSRELIQKLALKMNICHISGEIVAEAAEKLLKSTPFCHVAGFGLPTSSYCNGILLEKTLLMLILHNGRFSLRFIPPYYPQHQHICHSKTQLKIQILAMNDLT